MSCSTGLLNQTQAMPDCCHETVKRFKLMTCLVTLMFDYSAHKTTLAQTIKIKNALIIDLFLNSDSFIIFLVKVQTNYFNNDLLMYYGMSRVKKQLSGKRYILAISDLRNSKLNIYRYIYH